MSFLLGCFDFLDVATFAFLCFATFYSWKIYKRIPAQQIVFLFIGFLLTAILQLGFIAINYIPLGGTYSNRLIGEATVALRALPIGFIMIGMWKLSEAVNKYLNGSIKKNRRGTDR